MKNLLLTLLIISLASGSLQAQSKEIAELREEQLHGLHLYFYPSTLRMINIDKEESFYKLIEDIKSIRFLSFDNNEQVAERLARLKNTLEAGQFEELMIMRQSTMNIQILGHSKRDDQLVAMAQVENAWYLIEINGKFNPVLLSAQMQKGFNLGPINNFLEDKTKKEENRKRIQEMRRQQQNAESENTVPLKEDTFEDSTTN